MNSKYLKFQLCFKLSGSGIGSDSLNIQECPLGRTRVHGRRVIYPWRVREDRKKDSM